MQPVFAEFEILDDRFQVCLADCPDYLTPELLADILYTEHIQILEQTDVLIVRPRVDRPIPIQVFDSAYFSALTKRAPHASIHVLFSDHYKIMLSANINPAIDDKLSTNASKEKCIRWLQDKELYTYIKQSSALFQARPQFVYRAPSQRHVNMFLRVGSVQRNRQVIDAFFFWMLPYLKGRDAILTDTWSISSTALNTGRLLERYWTHLDKAKTKGDAIHRLCHVDMLSSYPDELLLVTPETRDALRRVCEEGARSVLVILSAVATGNSLALLHELVSQVQHKEDEFSFLALYRLDATQTIPYLCDLSAGISNMKFTPIANADIGNRTVIEIDRSTYFPLSVKETPLLISESHAAPAKDFFTHYRNASIISLHRNAVDLSNQIHRHHGIYIDVEAMLNHSRFKERLIAEIVALPAPPLVIITPPHKAGTIFAEAVAKELERRWERSVDVLVHPDLRFLSDQKPDQLKKAQSDSVVLIVDDVSVTGQRLSRYQQSLRELGYPGQIIYMLGVARPESDKSWSRRVKQLTFRSGGLKPHTVLCLEKVIMPDWDHNACPWCVESRGLTQLIQQGRLDSEIRATAVTRLMELEKSGQKGLIDTAIWRPKNAKSIQLTDNSIFIDVKTGPATEADVIASVAAALQQMRITKNEDNRLEVTYPHVSVLDTENYFGTRFNDDLLRLAIVRTAKAPELERWDGTAEEHRRAKVQEFLQNSDNQDIFKLELAVARLSRKIPQPNFTEDEWPKIVGLTNGLWRSLTLL